MNGLDFNIQSLDKTQRKIRLHEAIEQKKQLEKENKNDKSIFEVEKNNSRPQIFDIQGNNNTTIPQIPALPQAVNNNLPNQNATAADPKALLMQLVHNLSILITKLSVDPANTQGASIQGAFSNNQTVANPATVNQTVTGQTATNQLADTTQATNNAQIANNTTGGPVLGNEDDATKQKFSGAVDKVKQFLTNTGRTDLLNALGSKDLQVVGEKLPANYLGSDQGNLITINEDILKGSSEEKIGSILLHELNHFAIGSQKSSINEEFQSKKIEEDFLDSYGKGESTSDAQLLAKVQRIYKNLV